jgi:hypothetical protein
MSLYFSLAVSISWCCQAIDILLRVVWYIDTKPFIKYFVLVTYGLPIISLIYAISKSLFGYGGGTICFFKPDAGQYEDVYTLYLPLFLCVVIGTISMLIAFTVIFIRASKKDVVVHLAKFSVLSGPIFFVLNFFIPVVSIICYRYDQYKTYDRLRESITAWTICVFTEYDGIHDKSWESVCGYHPDHT